MSDASDADQPGHILEPNKSVSLDGDTDFTENGDSMEVEYDNKSVHSTSSAFSKENHSLNTLCLNNVDASILTGLGGTGAADGGPSEGYSTNAIPQGLLLDDELGGMTCKSRRCSKGKLP